MTRIPKVCVFMVASLPRWCVLPFENCIIESWIVFFFVCMFVCALCCLCIWMKLLTFSNENADETVLLCISFDHFRFKIQVHKFCHLHKLINAIFGRKKSVHLCFYQGMLVVQTISRTKRFGSFTAPIEIFSACQKHFHRDNTWANPI